MAASLGSNKRRSKVKDKRAVELSRWFSSSFVYRNHNHHHQQQQIQKHEEDDDEDGSLMEWTSHAWTLDELLRLYSNKLPIIVRSARGYYGQPGSMQLDVGQVQHVVGQTQ